MCAVLLMTTMLEDKILQTSQCPTIFNILAQSLSLDSRKSVCEVSSVVPVSEEMEMELDGGDNDEESGENKQYKECEDTLKDQQTALEILANLCTMGNGEEGDEDAQWEDQEDSDDQEFLEEDPSGNVEPLANLAPTNPVLLEALNSHKFVESVLDKANGLPENVNTLLQSSAKGKKLLKCHTNLRIRCFLCLSNMVEVLSVDDFGGPEALFSTWNSLGNLLVQQDQCSPELLDAASSCMRSVTAKLCNDKQGKSVMNITEKELEAIVQAGKEAQPEVRMNIVNIIGDICVLLSKSLLTASTDSTQSNVVEVFKVLVSWLLDGGCKDPDLRVVTESLDKLFDAFSEDYTDFVFFDSTPSRQSNPGSTPTLQNNLNMLSKLKSIENSFKIKLKAQRKELLAGGGEESLGIINMAKLNLKRFIKYKENRCK
eukprot:TRINITY_DN5999_c0_g1_i1.p1 TRINITY_DN5999_c0_g1~~TRINITY_DN5999_c0_g1_i1.p1  ORF type:complete len:483 (+),score=150.59 TRINITY_DN5999_c0_g1_i1:165-1451(+)